MTRISKSYCPALFLAMLLGAGLSVCPRIATADGEIGADRVERIIVKLRSQLVVRGATAAMDSVSRLSTRAGVALSQVRPMSGGARVLKLPRPMTMLEAQTVAQELMQDPGVEFAEPDRRVTSLFIPNDSSYSQQWYLHEADAEIAAANMPAAWDMTTGAASVVVAVLDTGIGAHADLDASRVLAGYDFISDAFIANDGDGRDTDPTDSGNWVTDADVAERSAMCRRVQRSSWHGLHIAGVIAASGHNSFGAAGLDWHAKLLPVRVLGKCGGYLSDVLDAMRWAAGVTDPYLPANPTPARIINMSLGAYTACTPIVQNAVDEAIAKGAVVVAAGGNDNGNAAAIAPGNCAGVVAVTALDRNGSKAYYASTGSTIALSAPGGAQSWYNDPRGIVSLWNTGETVPNASPGGDSYFFLQGTSMAAPQVAGVAALMLAVNSALTPAQVRHKLRATARAFPAGSSCTTEKCGSGMVDAAAALRSAANTSPPVADAGADMIAAPLQPITLTAERSSAAGAAAIAHYAWVQLSGTPVILSNPNSSTPIFVAPAAPEDLSFQLTVTDDSGLSASDTVAVQLAGIPFSASTAAVGAQSGGGGGCFIATAAYGSADAGDVRQLRAFRDRYLLKNAVGRAFVAAYYKFSPPLADAIRPYPLLRRLVRIGLAPYVAVARWLRRDDAAGSDV